MARVGVHALQEGLEPVATGLAVVAVRVAERHVVAHRQRREEVRASQRVRRAPVLSSLIGAVWSTLETLLGVVPFGFIAAAAAVAVDRAQAGACLVLIRGTGIAGLAQMIRR